MEAKRQVSIGRRIAFYCGYLAVAAGLVLFASLFFSGLDFSTVSKVRSAGLRAIAGAALIAAGLIIRRIAIRGLAGSLVILDPPRAKADLEPWSRAAGGLVDSALSEVAVAREAAGRLAGKPEVKVRCPGCGALNDEEARYCDQCGKGMGPAEPRREGKYPINPSGGPRRPEDGETHR